MAEAQKRSASRNRATGGSSKAASSGRNSRSSARTRQTSGNAGSRSRGNGASAQNEASRDNGGIGSAIKNVAVPVVTAAAGIVGGVVLERRQRRPRKVLGVPIPGTGSGLNGLASEVRKAGKQLGKLANEVQTTRKKAEDIGKALS